MLSPAPCYRIPSQPCEPYCYPLAQSPAGASGDLAAGGDVAPNHGVLPPVAFQVDFLTVTSSGNLFTVEALQIL